MIRMVGVVCMVIGAVSLGIIALITAALAAGPLFRRLRRLTARLRGSRDPEHMTPWQLRAELAGIERATEDAAARERGA